MVLKIKRVTFDILYFLSEEFLVQVGVHQESVFLPLLFAIVVDVISENAREGLMNEILYAHDLVFTS